MPRKIRTNGFYALRWKILIRDNFTCQYCGQKAPNVRLEVDHIKPVAEDGQYTEDNLITSCSACNRGKSALAIIIKRREGKPRPIACPIILCEGSIQSPRKGEGKMSKLLELLKEPDKNYGRKELASLLSVSPNQVGVMKNRLKRQGLIEK